jgi:hypothetical protein
MSKVDQFVPSGHSCLPFSQGNDQITDVR